jgi:hypothetical protein
VWNSRPIRSRTALNPILIRIANWLGECLCATIVARTHDPFFRDEIRICNFHAQLRFYDVIPDGKRMLLNHAVNDATPHSFA